MSLKSALSAGLFAILGSSAVGAAADTIYKCGNHYSQTPCPGGKALNIDDSRLPEQKKRHDAVIQRDAELAQNMEKSRLTQEQALMAVKSKPKSVTRKTSAKADRQQNEVNEPKRVSPKPTKPPGRKSQDFIAVVPGSDQNPAKKPQTKKPSPAAKQ